MPLDRAVWSIAAVLLGAKQADRIKGIPVRDGYGVIHRLGNPDGLGR